MARARPGGGEGGHHRRTEPVLLGDPGSPEQTAQLSGLFVLALVTVGFLGLGASVVFFVLPEADRPPGFHPLPIGLISAAVLVLAGLGRRHPEVFRPSRTAWFLAVAAVVLAVAAAFAGPDRAPFVTMFFVWYASAVTYLPRRVAVAVMAWVGVVYAALLVLQRGHFHPVGRWQITLGIMVTTALFMNRLVERAWALARAEGAARAKAEQARAELELVSAHKSRFLARMSHELRTPLNAIIGFSEVLGRRSFGELNPKQSQYVADVVDSGRHLLALVDDVLDLAKVESGVVDLDVHRVDVAALLTGSAALFDEQATRKGVALVVDAEPALGTVEADARKLKQVLFNLLANAVKFTPAGGRVSLGARRGGDRLRIWVSDTGPGIPPGDQDAIFVEFHAGAGGCGLGLPLARRLVELHGGRLWVESELGAGSTFTAELPVAVQPRRPTRNASARSDRQRLFLGEPDSPERRAETGRLIFLLAGGMAGLIAFYVVAFRFHPVREMTGYREVPFVVAVSLGLAIAAAAAIWPQRLGAPQAFPLIVALGIVNLSAGAYMAGPALANSVGLFYVCTLAAAIPVLTPRQTLAELGLLGASYGVVLALQDGNPAPAAQWATVMVFVTVSGLIFRRFVIRIEALALAERRARAETERVVAELEVASRHKTEFLANMSHELRTPLNVINGLSEVLASQAFGPLNAKQAEYAADVLAAGRHLLGLIDDILDLAKADAGRMELQLSDLDLEPTLEVAVASFQEAAASRRIDLVVEAGEGIGRIEADGIKLVQALRHLVSNALKFTPAGGRITVRAARDTDHVDIAVADTGRGIDPADHHRIFDPFAHSQDSSDTDRGSGLGLALARRYAELHGGSLGVSSDVGMGATFTLRLPLQRQGLEPRAPAEVA